MSKQSKTRRTVGRRIAGHLTAALGQACRTRSGTCMGRRIGLVLVGSPVVVVDLPGG